MMVPDRLWRTPPARCHSCASTRTLWRAALRAWQFPPPGSGSRHPNVKSTATASATPPPTAALQPPDTRAPPSALPSPPRATYCTLHTRCAPCTNTQPETPARILVRRAAHTISSAVRCNKPKSGRTPVPGSAQRFLLFEFGLATCQPLAAQHSPAGQPAQPAMHASAAPAAQGNRHRAGQTRRQPAKGNKPSPPLYLP